MREQLARWAPAAGALLVGGLASLAGVLGGHWLVWVALAALALLLALAAAFALRGRIRAEPLELESPARQAAARRAEPLGAPGAELRERFREALRELRGQGGGAGTDTLPWWVVLGEERAGKSALLNEGGLDVPARFSRRGFGATGSCEFVLSNQAVAIDTPGRWAQPASELEHGEWLQFLALLRQSRPACPLNGALIALDAPRLLERSPAELEAAALDLRRRLNELRALLGVDAPVYLVLTQADALEGFSDLGRALPPEWMRQAFGWTCEQRRLEDPGARVQLALAELAARVERLVPELLMRERDGQRQRRLFGLPRSLEALGQRTAQFAAIAFQRDRYGETPFLRGVYLTSARSKGSHGSALARLGLGWTEGARAEQAQGPLFVRELLREVVCGDEPLALRDRRLGPRARRALAVGAALFALGLLALWGASFAQNRAGMRALVVLSARALGPAPALTELAELRERSDAEAARAASPLHWLGFGRLQAAVARARAVYAFAFERSFAGAASARLQAALGEAGEPGLRALLALAGDVEFLARCGADSEAAPDWSEYLPAPLAADAAGYRAGYAAYVTWLSPAACQARLREQQRLFEGSAAAALDLARLEALDGGALEPLRYRDFGLRGDARSAALPGLYTAAGAALVARLLEAVQRAGAAAPGAAAQLAHRYAERHEHSWRGFVFGAPLAPQPRLPVRGSPLLALLERVDRDTRAALPGGAERAPWLAQLHALREPAPAAAPDAPGAATEAQAAAWTRYLALLDAVDLELEPAARSGERALLLAREIAEGRAGALGAALDAVPSLLPAQGELEWRSRLAELLRAPLLDGLGALLLRARGELERRWSARIAGPHGGGARLRELYAPGGALEEFVQQELAPFLQAERPRALFGERALPLGPRWLAWFEYAGRARREGAGALTAEPARSVRLRGVPSRVQRAAQTPEGLRVSRRELRFVCPELPEPPQLFVYQEGSGEAALRWEPGCAEISLRVRLVGPGSEDAEELRASWPSFEAFRSAARVAGERVLEWQLPGPLGSVVRVQYELLSGGEPARREPGLRPPPASLAQ